VGAVPSTTPGDLSPFGIAFGQKFPDGPVNESKFPLPLALEGFKVPMPPAAGLPMFYDYELLLLAQSNLIYSAQASRAYSGIESCISDRDRVAEVVRARIPDLEGGLPKFESEVFAIDLYCGYSEGARFIELNLAIFHKPTKEKIVVPDYSEFQKCT